MSLCLILLLPVNQTHHQVSSNIVYRLTLVELKSPQDDYFLACQQGDVNRVEAYLDSNRDGANTTDSQGVTGLHWAAINNRLLVCKLLLDNGATVDSKGGDLVATPMQWAAK